jgi:hypothetical protein
MDLPYLPNDVMNIILKFRTEEMKKQRDKLNYDKVIKELNETHSLLYGGKILFIESKSLDCSKLWKYSSPFIEFI